MNSSQFSKMLLLASAVLALLLIPMALSPDMIGAMSKMLIAALFALAFSLLAGQGGMLSFGHAAYFAIGSFATLHMMQAVDRGALQFPTPLLPLVGGVAGLVMGVVAGYFATLRSGVYFSMVTLAIAELLHILAPNLQTLFGGETGMSSMRAPSLGIGFGKEIEVYYLVLAWALAGALLLFLYTRTSFGSLTVALRENERRVAFLGFNLHWTKIVVFAVSSLFSGIAGGLFAITTESANYALFELSYSANVVLYSFIGGIGTFLGPALGAAAMTLFGHAASGVTRLWLLYLGLIFVLVMMYMPTGVGGFLSTQAGRMARGEIRHLPRRLSAVIPIFLTGVSAVFLLELVNIICSRDYQAEVVRTSLWAGVQLFGRAWMPTHVLTWALPVIVLLTSIRLTHWLLTSGDDSSNPATTSETIAQVKPAEQPAKVKGAR